MSKSIALLLTVGVVGLVSACAKPEPAPIYVDPEPISVEPVYTGKYK
jgi:hypothetical protein